jgi:hypothetical protein
MAVPSCVVAFLALALLLIALLLLLLPPILLCRCGVPWSLPLSLSSWWVAAW